MTKRQVVPGVDVEPRIAETARGKVEFDLTEGDGPVVLSVHGGLAGADQGRLNAGWLAGHGYRILSPSRPGYLGTPLDSGTTVEEQADSRHHRHDEPVRRATPGRPQRLPARTRNAAAAGR